jgi:hypothetical protein
VTGAATPGKPERQDDYERALSAEQALEELAAERNRLWAQLHERAAAEREVEHYRALVAQMESSKSWRLTAPLRGVTAFARDLLGLAAKARRYLADRRASR